RSAEDRGNATELQVSRGSLLHANRACCQASVIFVGLLWGGRRVAAGNEPERSNAAPQCATGHVRRSDNGHATLMAMEFDHFDVELFLRDYWQKKPLLIRNPWSSWSNPL